MKVGTVEKTVDVLDLLPQDVETRVGQLAQANAHGKSVLTKLTWTLGFGQKKVNLRQCHIDNIWKNVHTSFCKATHLVSKD